VRVVRWRPADAAAARPFCESLATLSTFFRAQLSGVWECRRGLSEVEGAALGVETEWQQPCGVACEPVIISMSHSMTEVE
jgi:hypothetical protein